MAAAIELTALTKRYGATVGIEQLDLEVEAGEVFGFLGPNGAGKTTTIRCLVGLLSPTAGTVRVLRLDPIADHARLTPQIGYLPGELRLYGELTGAQHLAILGDLQGRPTPRRDELCERLQLTGGDLGRLVWSHAGPRRRRGTRARRPTRRKQAVSARLVLYWLALYRRRRMLLALTLGMVAFETLIIVIARTIPPQDLFIGSVRQPPSAFRAFSGSGGEVSLASYPGLLGAGLVHPFWIAMQLTGWARWAPRRSPPTSRPARSSCSWSGRSPAPGCWRSGPPPWSRARSWSPAR
jgi:energy-coupling factor transporter ATP-binding protein EcfA2